MSSVTNRLFVDDWRTPELCANFMHRRGVNNSEYREHWNVIKTYGEFVRWITNNGLPDVISFDYDMADTAEIFDDYETEDYFNVDEVRYYTGMDMAIWLKQYCIDNDKKLPVCYVHSSNYGGMCEIIDHLELLQTKQM